MGIPTKDGEKYYTCILIIYNDGTWEFTDIGSAEALNNSLSAVNEVNLYFIRTESSKSPKKIANGTEEKEVQKIIEYNE
jgi:hypothetical protein